jgi:hypothetical protein
MPVLKTALAANGDRGQLRDATLGALMARVARNLALGQQITLPAR